MLPIDVIALLGKFGGYAVFVAIGMGFGAALEIAGFGDSRKLAAQFYLKEMTVLKTMFTAIIVAAVLIFLSAAVGILDFSQISVTQTFLWPGIVGGLIMGVGFIVGGYCPGTSLVSAASFKIDGIFFLGGTVLGAGLFGESLPAFENFWYSSFTERYLLSDWLGWSIGATLLAVVLMAIMMFYGAEKTEEYFRNKKTGAKMSWGISKRSYLFGASALVLTSVIVLIIGQPGPERKWTLMEAKYSGMLSSRDVFIHPLEYIKTYNEAAIKLVTIDLRSESEFNKFHISGSDNAKPEDFLNPENVAPLQQLPAQGVVVLIADNELESIQAWKYLKVQGVNNIYILDNGLHDWEKLFEGKTISGKSINRSSPPSELLQLFPKDAFTPKIKIATKKRSGGLCS